MYIPTNKNPGLYKTGYLQAAEGIQTAFKYKTLDREDIERIYAATGLEKESYRNNVRHQFCSSYVGCVGWR